MTAASLACVQVTCGSGGGHVSLKGMSSCNGLAKGVAFVPMVLKRDNTLIEMVLKRG